MLSPIQQTLHVSKVVDVATEGAGANDDEIIELWNKRNAVQMNPSVSHLSSFLPMVMEARHYPTDGTLIFKKGDKPNGFYFVREGAFECIDDDGTVVKTLNQGDVFGELGVFVKESRALSVQTASSDASSWFVDTKHYDFIINMKSVVSNNELQTILQEEYPAYLDLQKKKEAIKTLKLFKKELTEDEVDQVARLLKRISFEAEEDIVVKGSETTDMYFVESGVYEIHDSEGNFPNQKYFGELSFFLQQPRAATICASTPMSLLKLSREDLFDYIDEGRFKHQQLAMLAEQYQEAGLVEHSKQVYEYIQINLRPKKAPVSVHATLATVATGMLLIGLLPCFSPGFGENGMFHLFEFQRFSLSVPATQLQTLAFAIVAVLGSFRLPPNSPTLRRLFFNFTTLQCVLNYTLQDSNIVAIDGSRYTFDLLTVNPGSIFCWFIFALSSLWGLRLASEAISAPEKARSSIPLNGDAMAVSFGAVLMVWLQISAYPGCLLIMDAQAYNDIYLPFAHMFFESFVLIQFLVIQAGMSFAMLWATLLFERKITQTQCSILTFFGFWPIIDMAVDILSSNSAEALDFAHYNNGILFSDLHVNELVLLLTFGAVTHGMAVRSKTDVGSTPK